MCSATVSKGMDSLYTIEYSCSQRAFHITDIETTCATNIRACANGGVKNDYVVVGLTRNIEEASEVVDALEATGKFPVGRTNG